MLGVAIGIAAAVAVFPSTPSLLLSTRLAQSAGFAAGDTLTLQTAEGPVRFAVLAVTDEYGYFIDERAYGVMALEQMTRHFRVDVSAADRFTVVIEEGAEYE